MLARHLALFALLSAGAAQAVKAQDPKTPMPSHQGQMGMPMPGMMPGGMPGGMPGHMPMAGGGPASHLLQMKAMLGLTDDQVKKLEALQASQRTQLEPPESALLRARADLMDATKGEGDLAAARKALDKMGALHTDAMLAHLKARQDVRAILTADQKSKMDAMMSQHRGMGGMGRRGHMGGRMGGHGFHGGPPMEGMGPMNGMGPMGGMRQGMPPMGGHRQPPAPKSPEGDGPAQQP